MAFEDDEPPLERAYPYRTGWQSMGCMVLFLGLLGAGGAALVPFGFEKIDNGQMPLGVAFIIVGLFGAPMLLLALLALVTAVRETVNPPLLRVTPTALILPMNLRENSTAEEQDERGEPKELKPPAHPEEIPFSAIRWARREGPVNPGSHKLMIVHDLGAQTLVIEQSMMRAEDFDELETVLRAALPGVFTAAPPTPAPAPDPDAESE